MGDRSGQVAVEQHAVHEQPIVGCQRCEPFAGCPVLRPLGHVDVDSDTEVGREACRRFERVVGARERGVDTDESSTTGAEEPFVLGEAASSAVGAVSIGDAVGAHDTHPHLGARLGDHVEAALDRIRALVVVDDRRRAAHQRLGRAEQRAGPDHVEVERRVEAPPDLFEDLPEPGRLLRWRRHSPRERGVQMVVGAHHAGRRVGHVATLVGVRTGRPRRGDLRCIHGGTVV